jgi:hypothetical protein
MFSISVITGRYKLTREYALLEWVVHIFKTNSYKYIVFRSLYNESLDARLVLRLSLENISSWEKFQYTVTEDNVESSW